MLSIAHRSDTVHRLSCDTKTRSWRNCRGERWTVNGKQQTWTRLGASDDRNARSDVLYDECTVFGIAGKRVVPVRVLCQQHKEHDANRPHILRHIGNCKSHTPTIINAHKQGGEAQALDVDAVANRDDSPCVCALSKSRVVNPYPSQAHV